MKTTLLIIGLVILDIWMLLYSLHLDVLTREYWEQLKHKKLASHGEIIRP